MRAYYIRKVLIFNLQRYTVNLLVKGNRQSGLNGKN
ncbi:MAG: hypothetical protein ACI9LX_001231 [Paraglaciecola sp.]|jgi:hypothetical protein